MKLKKFEYGIIGIILLALIGIAWAIDEKVTVSYTPKGLTAANYGNFTHGCIAVEDNAIRYTLDGVTTPTSGSTGVGIKVEVGQSINLNLRDHIVNFKAVRNTSTDANLRATYW